VQELSPAVRARKEMPALMYRLIDLFIVDDF